MEITAFRSQIHWQMSPPMNEDLKKGDIVLAPLSYSDLVNNKLSHRLCCITIWM
jgi:hypothetical protein